MDSAGDLERCIHDAGVLLPALFRALEGLSLFARHVTPFALEATLAALGAPEDALKDARPLLEAWPDSMRGARTALAASSDATLSAYRDLRAAGEAPEPLMAVFQALRHVPMALSALYPLARDLPPVNAFFLDPARRQDGDLMRRLAEAEVRDDTAVMHVANAPGTRGGHSLYVPETYAPDRDWPLVVALHGGSGHGAAFLWSWLRDARTHGVILIAPTAIGRTWALQGDDVDTPNLMVILKAAQARYRIDPRRMMLTGLSDGGTFTYLSGLDSESPFTHLAPVAAAFHPMLTAFTEPARIAGLPVHIVHGARDWMFPAEMARGAARSLRKAGAAVAYTEIDDLAHAYPGEMNARLLAWADFA